MSRRSQSLNGHSLPTLPRSEYEKGPEDTKNIKIGPWIMRQRDHVNLAKSRAAALQDAVQSK